MMIGRLFSCWNSPFSGAMLNFGGVNSQELVSSPPYHVRLCCQGFHHSSMLLHQEFHHMSNICVTMIILPIFQIPGEERLLKEIHFFEKTGKMINYIYHWVILTSSLFVRRFAGLQGRFLSPWRRDTVAREQTCELLPGDKIQISQKKTTWSSYNYSIYIIQYTCIYGI